MHDPHFPVWGITGPIGSGKTTLAGSLSGFGAVNLEVDQVGHAVLARPDIQQQLARIFDPSILLEGGGIDRRRLGELAFASPEATASLNRVMHPAMKQEVGEILETERRKGTPLVLVNAALLYTMGLDRLCQVILYVRAPDLMRLDRIVSTRGLPVELARARLLAQDREPVDDGRVIFCDNDRSLRELEAWVRFRLGPLLPESMRAGLENKA
ncbi:MAG TPA: dephospho-CoA kinase [Candidatus Ozemobacteraceae bacterium]|nr:dephospho-CoA kinase [Candidatus Ozemobacteraceae bacterium]